MCDTCSRCDGDGLAHGSDRPFEWHGPGTYPGPCPVCKGTGKIDEKCPSCGKEIYDGVCFYCGHGLPELSEKEYEALKGVDLTSILGTPEEQIRRAMDAWLKQFRMRRKVEQENDRLRAALQRIAAGDSLQWHERQEIAREVLK